MSEHFLGINQPYYLPYLGFFDRAKACDAFVINTKSPLNRERANHRRARVIQLHPQAPEDRITLTQKLSSAMDGVAFDQIPLTTAFYETQKRHAQTLYCLYKRGKGFDYTQGILGLLESTEAKTLAEYNTALIMEMARRLQLGNVIRPLTDLDIRLERQNQGPTEANLEICLKAGATRHITGQNAPLWLDEARFRAYGIDVKYQKVGFSPYPQFRRPGHDFVQGISTLDLLFNVGAEAHKYIGVGSRVVDRETLLATTEVTGR